MKKPEASKEEVLALLDIIDGGVAPLDSRLKAIKRLEYILGRDILNTKEFRRIRDEWSATAATAPPERAEKPVGPKTKRTRHTPTRRIR